MPGTTAMRIGLSRKPPIQRLKMRPRQGTTRTQKTRAKSMRPTQLRSPKQKGKVLRSHLTLEQRRDELKSLKTKRKCMRSGTLGLRVKTLVFQGSPCV